MTTDDDFKWDDLTDENFFNSDITSVEEAKKTIVKPDTSEEESDENKESFEQKLEKTSDNDFWDITEDEENKLVNIDKIPEKEKEAIIQKVEDKKAEAGEIEQDLVDFYKSKAKLMIENGIFSNIKEEDIPENITEIEYQELQSKELDLRLDSVIENWKQSIGEEGAAFIKYTMNGGNVRDFLNQVSEIPDFSKLPVDTEENLISTGIKYLTTVDKKDSTEAKEYVNFLKDKGTLKTTVAAWKEKATNEQREKIESLAKTKEEEAKRYLSERKQIKEEYAKMINDVDSISGVKIQKLAKKDLASYITEPKNRDDGGYTTDLTDTLKDIFKDKKSLLALAAIVSNYDQTNKTFNLSDLAENAKKEQIKEVKNTLFNKKNDNTGGLQSKSTIGTLKDLSSHF